MTPKEIAASLATLSGDQLGTMKHADLYSARDYVPRGDRDAQNKISAYEHRAFAREATAENPLLAIPIAAGTLAYQPYKLFNRQSRSDPSLAQVGQGLLGVGEGLWGAFQEQMKSIPSRTAGTDTSTSATGLLESLRSYLREPSTTSKSRR